MPTYKLTYFNAKARAEPIRIMFAVGGIAYEDKRIEFAEWGALKASTAWGSMPILEVDDKTLGQSRAIYRYVAKVTGLAGKTDLEQADGDALVDTLAELFDAFSNLLFMQPGEAKDAALKEFQEKKLTPIGGNLEKFLSKNKGGDGYFVGDQLSWADLVFYHTFEFVGLEDSDALKPFPKMAALYDRVKGNAKVAEYLANRPVTDK